MGARGPRGCSLTLVERCLLLLHLDKTAGSVPHASTTPLVAYGDTLAPSRQLAPHSLHPASPLAHQRAKNAHMRVHRAHYRVLGAHWRVFDALPSYFLAAKIFYGLRLDLRFVWYNGCELGDCTKRTKILLRNGRAYERKPICLWPPDSATKTAKLSALTTSRPFFPRLTSS